MGLVNQAIAGIAGAAMLIVGVALVVLILYCGCPSMKPNSVRKQWGTRIFASEPTNDVNRKVDVDIESGGIGDPPPAYVR
jgi:hypothetical protein